MSYIKPVIFWSFVLSILLGITPFFVSARAQGQDAGDAMGEQSDGEQIDGEQIFEKPIKESKEETTLEKEYAERGVNWHAWAEKVSGAVWDQLIGSGAMICGQSRVRWQITNDCRVHIISVYSPIPDGAQALVVAIKALDHNPILAFPSGSQKTVVWRSARVGGRSIMHGVRGPVRVYP